VSVLYDLIKQTELPPVYRVRQLFDRTRIESVGEEIFRQFQKPEIRRRIRPGMRVAVTAGSRGVNNIAEILRETVGQVRALGAEPFIVTAMGSHGGATPEGQLGLLAELGITPDSVNAQILSSMEVVLLGDTVSGVPVYFAREAIEADATILAGRIKPHTAFRGGIESGVVKMGAIGLGKQKGAESFHSLGMENMAKNLVEMGRVVLEKANVAVGLAILENAYDQTYILEMIPAENLMDRERELLEVAKSKMACILPGPLDVLVVDEIGKNISGDGADPNITRRFYSPYVQCAGSPQRLVYLDLTPESHGNAIGLGVADFITQKLMDKIDYESMYMNVITNCVPEPAKLPLIMPNETMAVQAAIRTCLRTDPGSPRLAHIKNTLHLEEIYITLPLLNDVKDRDDLVLLDGPHPLRLDI